MHAPTILLTISQEIDSFEKDLEFTLHYYVALIGLK